MFAWRGIESGLGPAQPFLRMGRGIGVTVFLREWLPAWTTGMFEAISLLGDLVVIISLLALVYLMDVLATLRTSNASGPLCTDRTAATIGTVFGGLGFVVVLEAIFVLPRPPTELHAVTPSPYGFPSGHTLAAVVFWGAMARHVPTATRPTRLAIASIIVLLVGLSRLALGVHFLSDIVASIVFGLVYLVGIWRFTRGDPTRGFATAIAIALMGIVVTGGTDRALLAFAGTTAATLGWYGIEQPFVRKHLQQLGSRIG